MIASLPAVPIIAAILAAVLIAGIVKGSLGIGFPAVAMTMLPLLVEPALAVAIMALPIVITNGQQFLSVSGWPAIVVDVPSRWINMLVGLSLVVFALSALVRIDLKANEGPAWQIGVGLTAGLLGGVSAVKAPVMIYTVALDLPREQFIAVAGFLFFCGGVGLIGGLASAQMWNAVTLPLSAGAVVAGMAGFAVGARIRQHLTARAFRALLLWSMLLLGLRQVAVNLFA